MPYLYTKRGCGCKGSFVCYNECMIDLTGQTFGRLTAQWPVGRRRNNDVQWLCPCSCGKFRVNSGSDLRSGNSKSCGCLRKELLGIRKYKHGCTVARMRTREYNSWVAMKSRCSNPNRPCYEDYGGRGIKICERWHSFENFLADMGPRPKGTSIDRIDNDMGYFPSNCRWATRLEQNRNQRKRLKLSPNQM